MYNEEENVGNTISRVVGELDHFKEWELLVVNDGSTDRTLELAQQAASENSRIHLLSHSQNLGRGRALRTGFAHAQGDVILTLDADLTYDAHHISRLTEELKRDQGVDIVIGSPYLNGGRTVGVSPYHYRELLSRWGNKILSLALPGKLTTITGILRAYRRLVLDSMELESDGKEIHLEILSKALASGYRVREIPATLTTREKGKSKFDLSATVVSHLLFSFFEKPALLFGAIGILLVTCGLFLGGYMLWIRSTLNPTRPLMTLMVLLILIGIQVVFFAFVASQIAMIRKEIYKIQRENLQLVKKLEK